MSLSERQVQRHQLQYPTIPHSTIYSAMSSSWKLPRDVLQPPEDRACKLLPSEVLLKQFEEENENFDVDPALKVEHERLLRQVEQDMRSITNKHVDDRCNYIYPNDWSSLYQRKVVIVEKNHLIPFASTRQTFIESLKQLLYIFVFLYVLKGLASLCKT